MFYDVISRSRPTKHGWLPVNVNSNISSKGMTAGQITVTLDMSSPDEAFLFQAEDGIRDLDVTGVQTCALPISGRVTGRRGSAKPGTRGRPAWSLEDAVRRFWTRRGGRESRAWPNRGAPLPDLLGARPSF